MKHAWTIAAVAAIVTLLAAAPAPAAGVGAYYSLGTGTSTVRYEGISNDKVDIDLANYGLLYDTNVGKDEMFHYRLEFGIEQYSYADEQAEGLVMAHDFGFGVTRGRNMRFWLGPEIRLTRLNDKDVSTRPRLFGFGMGPAMGLNINIGHGFSLALKTAIISETLEGSMTFAGTRYDVTTEDLFTYTSVALIMRFGEN